MNRKILMLLALTLLGAGPGAAQTATHSSCPPPRHDVEMVKARLVELAGRGRATGISGFVSGALAPGPPPCPVLEPGYDVREVMNELTGFVSEQGDPVLERGYFLGLLVALQADARRAPPIPMQALVHAVETGRTAHGRGHALRVLLRLAARPEVRDYLLAQARAERGPPAWPDLPRWIVDSAYFTASERNAALRAALEADVSRIRDPTARCWVENRGRPGETPPGVGRRCPD